MRRDTPRVHPATPTPYPRRLFIPPTQPPGMSPIAEPIRQAIPERFRKYLPTRQERGKYTGPLSTFSEYHALGVGFSGGIMGLQYAEPIVAYAAGTGGGKARRSGHLKDAAQELGYTALGIVAGLAVRAGGTYAGLLSAIVA